MNAVEEKLIKSRIALLLKYAFFGTLVLSLTLVERKSIKTGATDGKNYFYNPDFVNRLTQKQVNFLTFHELLHCALDHIARRGNRMPKVWNYATDYFINDFIKELDPKEETFQFIPGILYDVKYKGLSAEEIYNLIIDDKELMEQIENEKGFSFGNGEGSVLDDHDIWDEMTDAEKDELGKEWERKLVSAAQSTANTKDKGNIPALFERMIWKITNPQKDWNILLQEFLTFEVNDYGFTPPDRRFSGYDFIMPDFSEVEGVVKKIVFLVDISGSVSDKEYEVCANEIIGCINQFNGNVEGKLIFTDCVVLEQNVYNIEDIVIAKPVGGGGTDFRPAFKWIEDNLDEVIGAVFLTDTYATFPDDEPPYPVLWVKTVENGKVPWGAETFLDVKV